MTAGVRRYECLRPYSNRQDRKTQVVQIDSRLSNTAAKADRWISINPGTEGNLALGVAHQIISESLYNKAFVDNFSGGFDTFRQKVLADFSPAKVADITGVSTDLISEMAMKFATAQRPLAICGRGRGNATRSTFRYHGGPGAKCPGGEP